MLVVAKVFSAKLFRSRVDYLPSSLLLCFNGLNGFDGHENSTAGQDSYGYYGNDSFNG